MIHHCICESPIKFYAEENETRNCWICTKCGKFGGCDYPYGVFVHIEGANSNAREVQTSKKGVAPMSEAPNGIGNQVLNKVNQILEWYKLKEQWFIGFFVACKTIILIVLLVLFLLHIFGVLGQ